MREIVKNVLNKIGIQSADLYQPILLKSIKKAAVEQKLTDYVSKLCSIVPDISNQYTTTKMEGPYLEAKVRTLHAFQMRLFKRAARMQSKNKMTVVDIGDSAGTHLLYIKKLCKDIFFAQLASI